MRSSLGVTLVELLTVLVVLGVLATVVAPSFRGMMVRQRVQGVQDQLITDLQLARSEQAARANATTPVQVAVTFGGNAQISCYTVHTVGAACDCTAAPGSACSPGAQEIRTVQVARAQGVSLAASSAGGSAITFSPPQGTATPTDLAITVQGDPSGQLRTQLSAVGSPSVCSPDGSIRGVPTCP
ncbi:MAG: GspH/FimT family pseudopilin [Burkholderiaceae bacterium]